MKVRIQASMLKEASFFRPGKEETTNVMLLASRTAKFKDAKSVSEDSEDGNEPTKDVFGRLMAWIAQVAPIPGTQVRPAHGEPTAHGKDTYDAWLLPVQPLKLHPCDERRLAPTLNRLQNNIQDSVK
jgi:hypothetical protein